jgi:cysteine synthase A
MENKLVNRESLYRELEAEVRENLCLREITSDALKRRNHRNFVWDATQQPTGSHYFPVYVELFRRLEQRGEIHPDKHFLVETTTGNAGAAAAFLAERLGYDILIFMPEDMPEARINDVQNYLGPDSELRFSEPGEYVSGMVKSLRRFLAQHRDEGYRGKEIYPLDHSRRPESIDAIEKSVSTLLKRDMPSGLVITTSVVALGNGTSFSGVSRAVRDQNENATCIGMEPAESPWFYTQLYGEDCLREQYGIEINGHKHEVLGTGGWGVDFPNLKRELVDDIDLAFEQRWREKLQDLHDLGYLIGHSSAACQSIIDKRSQVGKTENETYFSLFYDSIETY